MKATINFLFAIAHGVDIWLFLSGRGAGFESKKYGSSIPRSVRLHQPLVLELASFDKPINSGHVTIQKENENHELSIIPHLRAICLKAKRRLTGAFNQVSILEKNTTFCSLISSRAALQALVATELQNLNSFALKDAMMKGIENILATVVKMCFLAAEISIKRTCFSFIQMALTNIVPHRLTDQLIHNSLERWIQAELLTNQMAKEMCKYSSLSKLTLK